MPELESQRQSHGHSQPQNGQEHAMRSLQERLDAADADLVRLICEELERRGKAWVIFGLRLKPEEKRDTLPGFGRGP